MDSYKKAYKALLDEINYSYHYSKELFEQTPGRDELATFRAYQSLKYFADSIDYELGERLSEISDL